MDWASVVGNGELHSVYGHLFFVFYSQHEDEDFVT